MEIAIAELVHPRLQNEALRLFGNVHYKAAAHEAMTQVEMALKEVSGTPKETAAEVIKRLFKTGDGGIKLIVPFGEHLQPQAAELFRGAFTYYRNYTAHDGSNIDKEQALRIMILATELLRLINSSRKSFIGIGGGTGLVKLGAFKDLEAVHRLLKMLDGYCNPEDVYDGFFEDLAKGGYEWDHVEALLEFGLITIEPFDVEPDPDNGWPFEKMERYKLTALGRAELKGIWVI